MSLQFQISVHYHPSYFVNFSAILIQISANFQQCVLSSIWTKRVWKWTDMKAFWKGVFNEFNQFKDNLTIFFTAIKLDATRESATPRLKIFRAACIKTPVSVQIELKKPESQLKMERMIHIISTIWILNEDFGRNHNIR